LNAIVKLCKIALFHLLVVGFSRQRCCSSKSVSHFWNTRPQIIA